MLQEISSKKTLKQADTDGHFAAVTDMTLRA
jgi:hypothetical protein